MLHQPRNFVLILESGFSATSLAIWAERSSVLTVFIQLRRYQRSDICVSNSCYCFGLSIIILSYLAFVPQHLVQEYSKCLFRRSYKFNHCFLLIEMLVLGCLVFRMRDCNHNSLAKPVWWKFVFCTCLFSVILRQFWEFLIFTKTLTFLIISLNLPLYTYMFILGISN